MRALLALALTAAILGAHAAAGDKANLPDYKPQAKVAGMLRIWGEGAMAAVLKKWQEGFRKYHPDIRFAADLKGSDSGIYGLEMRTADLALMGRAIYPYERYGTYERSWYFPVEIEVATGSVQAEGKSPAYAVFVHRDNPLAQLTVKQLDGIFGAQRGGGWKGLSWDLDAARSSAEDIRSWGALGVGGALAGQPIHVYGPPLLGAGAVTYFQARVFGGGAMWNEDLREYADARRMIAELAHDPSGIAYAPLACGSAGVKAIALAETAAGPYAFISPRTVADRSYPLSRPVYLVYTIDNERTELANPRVDPKVKEFLRYVLSRQGQADIAREGAYLPLTPAMAREQWRKVESEEPAPERQFLR